MCLLFQDFIHAHSMELIHENSTGGEFKAKGKAWHYIFPIVGMRLVSLNKYCT